MTSFKRETLPRQVPPPPNSRASTTYTRFIPREELQSFAAWTPAAFGATTASAEPGPAWPANAQAGATAATTADAQVAQANSPDTQAKLDALRAALAAAHQAELKAQVAAARSQGYQDGYRDGLVALDSFKQSFASQVSSQIGQLLASLDSELGVLEQQMASSVARVATELARQVVRSELSVRPALVAQVAREAVNTVLMSARQITVLVHPDDQALVAAGCEEALAARGARLRAQPSVARGGCRVESDAGVIDARIEARWLQATHALGTGVCWDDGPANPAAPGADA
jgi:flagellar assembly protein FliH